MLYVIQVCWGIASKQSANRYGIYHCCVHSAKLLIWTEELSETCRVLFQNKFEKLVHLFGFIIRIYHDAWSPELQNKKCILNCILLSIPCVTLLFLIFTPIRRNSCLKFFTFGCRNCTKQINFSHCESACIRPDFSNFPYLHKMCMSSL